MRVRTLALWVAMILSVPVPANAEYPTGAFTDLIDAYFALRPVSTGRSYGSRDESVEERRLVLIPTDEMYKYLVFRDSHAYTTNFPVFLLGSDIDFVDEEPGSIVQRYVLNVPPETTLLISARSLIYSNGTFGDNYLHVFLSSPEDVEEKGLAGRRDWRLAGIRTLHEDEYSLTELRGLFHAQLQVRLDSISRQREQRAVGEAWSKKAIAALETAKKNCPELEKAIDMTLVRFSKEDKETF